MRAGLQLLVTVVVLIRFDVHYAVQSPIMRMCYYRTYARYRNTIAKFELGNIDFSLCTHYIYGFAKVDNRTMLLQPSAPSIEEGSSGLFKRFLMGKRSQLGVKTLLAFGGSDMNTYIGLVAVGQTELTMQAFAASAINLARDKGFDGLVMDWQPPVEFDTRNITVGVMKALKEQCITLNITNLLLIPVLQSIPVYPDMNATVSKLINYVSYIIVKAYDFPMNGMKVALFNSPLYARLRSQPYIRYCVNHTVLYWNSLGIDYKKMVVGMTGVGRILELVNVSKHQPGSGITSTVEYGPYYNIRLGLAYPEVCVYRAASQYYFDDLQKNPYLIRGHIWIGYEDKKSIEVKIKWFQNLNIAGIMFAGLDEDDFTGTLCNEGRYPLLSRIRDITQPDIKRIPTTTKSPDVDAEIDDKDSEIVNENTKNSIGIILSAFVLFILGYGVGHIIIGCRNLKTVVGTEVYKPPLEEPHASMISEKKTPARKSSKTTSDMTPETQSSKTTGDTTPDRKSQKTTGDTTPDRKSSKTTDEKAQGKNTVGEKATSEKTTGNKSSKTTDLKSTGILKSALKTAPILPVDEPGVVKKSLDF